MIFTIPLTILYFFLYGLLSVLPQVGGLSSDYSAAFEWAFGFLYAFDFVLPVSFIITLLGLSLSFELAVQIWYGVH